MPAQQEESEDPTEETIKFAIGGMRLKRLNAEINLPPARARSVRAPSARPGRSSPGARAEIDGLGRVARDRAQSVHRICDINVQRNEHARNLVAQLAVEPLLSRYRREGNDVLLRQVIAVHQQTAQRSGRAAMTKSVTVARGPSRNVWRPPVTRAVGGIPFRSRRTIERQRRARKMDGWSGVAFLLRRITMNVERARNLIKSREQIERSRAPTGMASQSTEPKRSRPTNS